MDARTEDDGDQRSQGLYRASDEHDACGVGFVAHIKGAALARHRPPRARPAHQPRTPRRRRLRSRHRRRRRHPRADARSRSCAARAVHAAARRRVRRRARVPAHRGRGAPRSCARWSSASPARKARRCSAGARCPPTSRPSAATPPRSRRRSRRCSSAASPAARRSRRRRALRAQALRHPQAHRARGRTARPARPRRARRSTSSACRPQTLIYKGMLTASQIEAMFPDLSDPALESALALVHQRFSTNTFPSWPLAHPVPLRGAQRRDQHAARQRQLDAGARRAAAVERVRRRPAQGAARDPPGRQRHGDASTTCSSSWSWPAARCRTPC